MRLDDLRGRECQFCGKPIPDSARSDKIFCSDLCRRRDNQRVETEAVKEARLARTCAFCEEPISMERRVGSSYCSQSCYHKHLWQMQSQAVLESKWGRTCVVCGDPIGDELRIDAIYCTARCKVRAANRRQYARQRPLEPRRGQQSI